MAVANTAVTEGSALTNSTAGVPSTAVTSFGSTGTLNINTVISDGKPTT